MVNLVCLFIICPKSGKATEWVKLAKEAGYYVSLLDWNHPDYDPTGSGISYPEGNLKAAERGERQFGNHEKYKEYLYNIFNDLLSQYKVDLVWWDFSQPHFQGDKAWGATRLMRRLLNIISQLQVLMATGKPTDGKIVLPCTFKKVKAVSLKDAKKVNINKLTGKLITLN